MEHFRRRNWRRWKGITVPLIALVVTIGLLVLIVYRLNAPAQGSISQTPPSQIKQNTGPYANPGTFNGKYLTFQYPPHFKTLPTKLTGDILETVEYTSTDLSGTHISVEVFKGAVTNDSGVSYRRQHPELYKENDSRSWIEFTRLDSTEDTFFIQHNDLEATVSATTPSDNLSGQAQYVASSLKWK